MPRAAIEDPIKVFNFVVEEAGFKRAGFRECNGLEGSAEVSEYREGGQNATVQKSPGLISYGNITLIRGQIVGSQQGGDDDLLNWWKQVGDVTTQGVAANFRRDVDIVQFDATRAEARRWTVYNAFPVRFKPMSDANATSNDNSVEEVELAHEGFTT